MRKLALALMAVSASVFGFGIVASAQSYDQAISTSPTSPAPGAAYSVTYTNCVAGDVITFSQPQSSPTSVTGTCDGAAQNALTGSVLGIVLPRQAALGTATGNFQAAPTAPGTYNGTAVGAQSPQLTFQLTVPGQAPATTAVVTPTAPLPATGSSGLGTTMGVALGLLAVGIGLFVVAQVRRRQNNAVA
jgi:hypothetical protein